MNVYKRYVHVYNKSHTSCLCNLYIRRNIRSWLSTLELTTIFHVNIRRKTAEYSIMIIYMYNRTFNHPIMIIYSSLVKLIIAFYHTRLSYETKTNVTNQDAWAREYTPLKKKTTKLNFNLFTVNRSAYLYIGLF